jgi:hypothetical protein
MLPHSQQAGLTKILSFCSIRLSLYLVAPIGLEMKIVNEKLEKLKGSRLKHSINQLNEVSLLI